jgi:hypothetical protein
MIPCLVFLSWPYSRVSSPAVRPAISQDSCRIWLPFFHHYWNITFSLTFCFSGRGCIQITLRRNKKEGWVWLKVKPDLIDKTCGTQFDFPCMHHSWFFLIIIIFLWKQVSQQEWRKWDEQKQKEHWEREKALLKTNRCWLQSPLTEFRR